MTGLDIALLIFPTAGLIIGAVAYWIATRPEKHHPAE